MERWQRDLYILWACNFVLQLGFSLIMPFLSLYLEDLGVQGPAVELWSGIIFSANFVVMALISPVWGALSDRTGRKRMMLRSAFGMGSVVWLMGFVANPWQLLGLRFLQGVFSGFIPAVTAYMAGAVPRERSGYVLGLLSTGSVAGTILGPLVGGALAKVMGYRPIFVLTSVSCLVAGAAVFFLIKENFTPVPKQKGDGFLSDLKLVSKYPMVIAMAGVLFLNMFSVLTAEPILARFLQELKAPAEWVEMLSGLVFSMTGVATIIVAPQVGRLADQLGSRRLLAICLSGAATIYVAQTFATAVWHMVALRFLLGLFSGGLMPAANALIAKSVPQAIQGRVFGLTSSAIFVGNTLGPLVGGTVAASFGLRSVFPVTATLLILNLVWVLASVREHPGDTEATA